MGFLCAGPLLPYRQALLTDRPPERILVLGGDVDRERAGLQLARQLRLPLVVSGGSNPEYAQWLMEKEGLSAGQVVRQATGTPVRRMPRLPATTLPTVRARGR